MKEANLRKLDAIRDELERLEDAKDALYDRSVVGFSIICEDGYEVTVTNPTIVSHLVGVSKTMILRQIKHLESIVDTVDKEVESILDSTRPVKLLKKEDIYEGRS